MKRLSQAQYKRLEMEWHDYAKDMMTQWLDRFCQNLTDKARLKIIDSRVERISRLTYHTPLEKALLYKKLHDELLGEMKDEELQTIYEDQKQAEAQ